LAVGPMGLIAMGCCRPVISFHLATDLEVTTATSWMTPGSPLWMCHACTTIQ
jgi:hypothetical protein